MRIARLVERADAGADGSRFGGPVHVVLEHGPVVFPGPRVAARTADPASLEAAAGLVSVESSGFLVAARRGGRTEVCYVVQERVGAGSDDCTPHWTDPGETRWRWMLVTRAASLARLRDLCEATRRGS